MKTRFSRKRVFICLLSILLPILIVLGALIGVYFPKAPDVHAKTLRVNNVQLNNGMESLHVEVDVDIEIKNVNKDLSVSFDPVIVEFYFPDDMSTVIGKGELEAGTIRAGGTIIRSMSTVFDAPWNAVGSNFIRSIQTEATSLILKSKVVGYADVLKKQVQLSTDLTCTVSYNWNTKQTSRKCVDKPHIVLPFGN